MKPTSFRPIEFSEPPKNLILDEKLAGLSSVNATIARIWVEAGSGNQVRASLGTKISFIEWTQVADFFSLIFACVLKRNIELVAGSTWVGFFVLALFIIFSDCADLPTIACVWSDHVFCEHILLFSPPFFRFLLSSFLLLSIFSTPNFQNSIGGILKISKSFQAYIHMQGVIYWNSPRVK